LSVPSGHASSSGAKIPRVFRAAAEQPVRLVSRMYVHVRKPRDQEVASPIDSNRGRWNRHGVARTERADPTVTDEERLMRQRPLHVHWRHGHVDER